MYSKPKLGAIPAAHLYYALYEETPPGCLTDEYDNTCSQVAIVDVGEQPMKKWSFLSSYIRLWHIWIKGYQSV